MTTAHWSSLALEQVRAHWNTLALNRNRSSSLALTGAHQSYSKPFRIHVDSLDFNENHWSSLEFARTRWTPARLHKSARTATTSTQPEDKPPEPLQCKHCLGNVPPRAISGPANKSGSKTDIHFAVRLCGPGPETRSDCTTNMHCALGLHVCECLHCLNICIYNYIYSCICMYTSATRKRLHNKHSLFSGSARR